MTNAPLKLGKIINSELKDKVHVIFNKENLGVGGATKRF